MNQWTVLLPFLLGASLAMQAAAAGAPLRMLLPGFTVRELPVRLSNVNNLRFAPDGRLTALGYDGRVHLLRDTDGDGLEDRADVHWAQPSLSVPVGMVWSDRGLIVSSKGKISLLRDADGNGEADVEEVIASGWPPTDVGSGGVDATAVTLDAEGNIYFGLLVADYSNAYRLRKRRDLKPAERAWLVERGRPVDGPPDEEVSLYDVASPRGTIQRWNAGTRSLEAIATGIRVPYTLAFNRAGDLFVTDQEGETWMPGGNPLDELNHIVPGRNYGFPPRHPRWLPDLQSEPPVVSFGPQHQSACGFVFNEERLPVTGGSPGHAASGRARPAMAGQGRFGPAWWEGDAIVAGESRGKLWRVHLAKTPRGYAGLATVIARSEMLVTDVAISPAGELYVSCHSGPPDWGTGPQGEGRLFRIAYTDPGAPQPVLVWPHGPRELRIAFDRPVDPDVTRRLRDHRVEAGEAVSAGDRFEVLKPPYAAVQAQEASPRRRSDVASARLLEDGRVLALETAAPLDAAAAHAITIVGLRSVGSSDPPVMVDVGFGDTRTSNGGFAWENGRLAWTATGGASSASPRVAAASPAPPGGDWERGRGLFFGESLQCAKCHRVRGEGGMAGPDLSNLVARDAASVLRDIREPGASIHPDYTGYEVRLRDGRELTGFVVSQDAAGVRVRELDGRETVAGRADVASLRPLSVSLMPEGLLAQRSEREVRDLLTFLVTAPPPPPPPAAAPPAAAPAKSRPLRTRAEVESVLGGREPARSVAALRPLRLVLVASKQDHGPGEHDYPRWQTNWVRWLAGAENVSTSAAWEWPSDEQWRTADAAIFYFWNHDWSVDRLAQLDRFLARGGGVVVLHAACIADKEPETLARRLGLAAQPVRTKYRHGPLELKPVRPGPALVRGLPDTIRFVDETYWPMIGDVSSVEVLATAEEEGRPWPMFWTSQRGGGRVFGSILGHYSWTFDDPFFRVLVLRGVAWVVGEEEGRLEGLVLDGAELAD